MGAESPDGQPSSMTSALANTIAYAALTAMLLALVAVGPATAGTVTREPAAEKYALSLLNCTRTGGFVQADGTCVGRGSGKHSAYRKPVRLHKDISLRTSWPWARTMVRLNACEHVIAGKPSPATRMRSSGFRYWYYGENIGCAWSTGDTAGVVLGTHRAMQAEKSSNGGHWQNIKNRSFKSVGIGVAKGDGRVMVVWDFYGKRY
jgi:hypothetical protein